MMRKEISLVLFTFIMIISCSEKNVNEPGPVIKPTIYGDISGIIYKSQTEIPIAGARVSIDSIIYTTSINGKYDLVQIPIGRKTITVQKSSYETYSETIEIEEGKNNKNIYLTSLIQQKLSGRVVNSLNIPIKDVKITVNNLSTQTNSDGEFEILNLVEGNYTISAEHGEYDKYEENFDMTEGSKVINIYLIAKKISQMINNISLEKEANGIKILWDNIDSSILDGYNLYCTFWSAHTVSGNLIEHYNGDREIRFNFPDYEKLNDNILKQTEYFIQTQDYNAGYKIYILPVNIDGLESEYIEGQTNIGELLLDWNVNNLGFEFDLTNVKGPVEIPVSDHEIVLLTQFFYQNIMDVQILDWDIYISTDMNSWNYLGYNGTKVWPGPGVPAKGGYLKTISLNSYKGLNVYFKTQPEIYNGEAIDGIEIRNSLIEYVNYD